MVQKWEMKIRLIALVIVASALLTLAFSFRYDKAFGVHENIAVAIRTGNFKALAGYFSTTVEISLPTKEGTYSRVQAEMVMKEFFQKNPPTSFILEQKGTSSGCAQFIIGTYKSGNKELKTYILLKSIDGQLLIQQLQFESD